MKPDDQVSALIKRVLDKHNGMDNSDPSGMISEVNPSQEKPANDGWIAKVKRFFGLV